MRSQTPQEDFQRHVLSSSCSSPDGVSTSLRRGRVPQSFSSQSMTPNRAQNEQQHIYQQSSQASKPVIINPNFAQLVSQKLHEIYTIHSECAFSSNLLQISKDFIGIADNYHQIAQAILTSNADIFTKEQLRENHLRALESRLHADHSEQNCAIIMTEAENVKAHLVSETESPAGIANAAIHESNIFNLIKQRQICTALAEAIATTVSTNHPYPNPLFASALESDQQQQQQQLKQSSLEQNKKETASNQNHNSDSLFNPKEYEHQQQLLQYQQQIEVQQLRFEQQSSELRKVRQEMAEMSKEMNKSNLQRQTIERVYLKQKQILANHHIEIPEQILLLEDTRGHIGSPTNQNQQQQRSRNQKFNSRNLENQLAEIESQKELVDRLVTNNKQLNELAKKILAENKDLKREIVRLQREAISAAAQQQSSNVTVSNFSTSQSATATPTSHHALRSPKQTYQFVSFQNQQSQQQQQNRLVFESISDRYSKSPSRSPILLNTEASAFKSKFFSAKEKFLEDEKKLAALDKANSEVQTMKQLLSAEQFKNKKLFDALSKEKAQTEIEIVSLEHAHQEQLTQMYEQINLLESKCASSQQDRNALMARLKESKSMNDRLQNLVGASTQQHAAAISTTGGVNNGISNANRKNQAVSTLARIPSQYSSRNLIAETSITPDRSVHEKQIVRHSTMDQRLRINSPIDHRSKMSKPTFSPVRIANTDGSSNNNFVNKNIINATPSKKP